MGTTDNGVECRPAGRVGQVPRVPRLVVPRPRLSAPLDDAPALTLLDAPLGFGKTTLIAQWLRDGGFASGLVGWLRVPAGEPAGFWDAVDHQLHVAGLPDAEDLVKRATPENIRRSIARAGQPVLLVLDQFERASRQALELELLELLRDSPALRLVVCTRNPRAFRDQRLSDLDVSVLDSRQLAFTISETAELLAAAGVPGGRDRAAAIQSETGGWPEPTRGIVLALAAPSADRPQAADAQTASDVQTATRIAGEFFRERWLPEVAQEATVDFLLATSVPDALPVELAAELTESDDVKSRLECLERHGVLSHESTDQGPVYRWPPAGRRALLAELVQHQPARARRLRGRAARWYLEQGEVAPALRYALAAGDLELTVEIVETHWVPLLLGERELLFAALGALPAEALSGRVRGLAVRDIVLRRPDDEVLAEITDLPAGRDELGALGRSAEALDVLLTGLLVLQVFERRGLFLRAREYAARLDAIAAAVVPVDGTELCDRLPGIVMNVGVARMLADDLEGARPTLERAYEHAHDVTGSYVQRDSAGKLALLSAVSGDVTLARSWLDRFHEGSAPIPAGWLRRSAEFTARLAGALIAIEELELEEAAGLLAAADDVGAPEPLWAYGGYALARYSLYTSDPVAGLRRLDDAVARHAMRTGAGSTAGPLLTAVEADLLLAAGRGNEAARVLDAAVEDHPLLRVARARFALLTGDLEAVLRLAKDITWARQVGRRQQLDMMVLRAVAHHRLDQPRAAMTTVRAALAAARLSGTLRPFTTVPRSQLEVIAAGVSGAGLLDAAALRRAPEVFPPAVELVRLTTREQVFLNQLAAGLGGAQIAQRLYISVNTAKTHLRSLYRKLGAGSRQEALTRAAELGLLLSRDDG